MKSPMTGGPEFAYLRRYFDAVDRATTSELVGGASLDETQLTFVFARLMDGSSSFQQLLDYSLDQLNADLAKCKTGMALDVEFTTNEHNSPFEGAISFADLGIVLRFEATDFTPEYEKAVLLQAKKLYLRDDRTYRLESRYRGFDVGQYHALNRLTNEAPFGAYYLLYNPQSDSFEDSDRVTSAEHRVAELLSDDSLFSPLLSDFPERRLFRKGRAGIFPSHHFDSPDEVRAQREAVVKFRPGVRLLDIWSIERLLTDKENFDKKTFSLRDCYEFLMRQGWRNHVVSIPFAPLSTFMVPFFMGCIVGSDNSNFIDVANGKRVGEVRLDGTNIPYSGVAARHTLRITLRNTLSHERGVQASQT